jgi:excisionase family DNA binding protein
MIKPEKEGAVSAAVTIEIQPRFLRVASAVQYCGIPRSALYELMSGNKIRSYRIGKARLIDRESLDALITAAA